MIAPYRLYPFQCLRSRYAWDKCTAGCTRDGLSEYGCPSAAAAYNDLAGNEEGTPAFIVGTAGEKLKPRLHVDFI